MSLLSNALSGVLAARASLDASSQNLANATTVGYTRQRAVLTAQGASRSGTSAGDGVVVNSLARFTDRYKTQQLWLAASTNGQYEAPQQYLTQLEQVLSESTSNLNTGMDGFFSALSAASVDPTSSPLRQQIIDSASALGQQFNNMRMLFSNQIASINRQRTDQVDMANLLAKDIAQLNDKIIAGQANGFNVSALIDQRSNKIDELSGLANLQVIDQPDGSVNVSLRNGQPLVQRSTAATLQTYMASGTQGIKLTFVNDTVPLNPTDLGGSLGGLSQYEVDVLRPMDSAALDIADEFTSSVNSILTSGFDVTGNPGSPLFVFNAAVSSSTVTVNPAATALNLGLSSDATKPGNSDKLLALINLNEQLITVSSLGSVPIGDAYTQLIGRLATRSQQNQASMDTSVTVREQAELSWQSTSGVNTDEEAVNLVQYQQMYQANMKVIAVVNELIDAVLQIR